jgi:hypothetical protein
VGNIDKKVLFFYVYKTDKHPFFFNELRSEVIVGFVDVIGMIKYHLNFFGCDVKKAYIYCVDSEFTSLYI